MIAIFGRLEVNVHTKQQQEKCFAGLPDKLGMQLLLEMAVGTVIIIAPKLPEL